MQNQIKTCCEDTRSTQVSLTGPQNDGGEKAVDVNERKFFGHVFGTATVLTL